MKWIIRLCSIKKSFLPERAGDSAETSRPTGGEAGLFFDRRCSGLCTKMSVTAFPVILHVQCQGLLPQVREQPFGEML